MKFMIRERQDQINFVLVIVFWDGFCMETMLQLITWRRVIGPEVLVLLLPYCCTEV